MSDKKPSEKWMKRAKKKQREVISKRVQTITLECPNSICKVTIVCDMSLPRPTRCGKCGSILREV